MSRVQLALNVSDLKGAIAFYTKLFGSAPAKVQPGYANFAVTDPPLKLVLMENPDAAAAGGFGALNHLGVEVATPDEVGDAVNRLRAEGLETDELRSTTCCYAVQDKVWVADPDHTPWEIYAVLEDAPARNTGEADGMCCTTGELAAPDTCC